MDIFFHAVAGATITKESHSKTTKPKRLLLWAALFGSLPDLLSFAPAFVGNIFQGGAGHHVLANGYDFAAMMYPYTHSLVIGLLVILLARIIFKNWWVPLFGWIAHILVDIPTHPVDFFPTPLLFPVSDWVFPYGVYWGASWVFYSLWGALIVFLLVRYVQNRQRRVVSDEIGK